MQIIESSYPGQYCPIIGKKCPGNANPKKGKWCPAWTVIQVRNSEAPGEFATREDCYFQIGPEIQLDVAKNAAIASKSANEARDQAIETRGSIIGINLSIQAFYEAMQRAIKGITASPEVLEIKGKTDTIEAEIVTDE